MAFKPKTQPSEGKNFPVVQRNYPVPEDGARPARVSLIVDMGIQEREDFEDKKTGEVRPQKPCQQIAVFVDLVEDRVDYGGDIGEQLYRLPVNSIFKGEFKGINFLAVPQKDGDGNILKDEDGKWLPPTLHPASPVTKIAKAVGKPDVIHSMDIEQLLGQAFMATVEVKKTVSKDKVDEETGQPITYTNVNFKGAAPVYKGFKISDLDAEPLLISFENATPETVKFIRANLRKQIKLAKDYPGSQMQKAIEAYEASLAADRESDEEGEKKPATKPKAGADKAAAKAAKEKAEKAKSGSAFDDMEDDVPF